MFNAASPCGRHQYHLQCNRKYNETAIITGLVNIYPLWNYPELFGEINCKFTQGIHPCLFRQSGEECLGEITKSKPLYNQSSIFDHYTGCLNKHLNQLCLQNYFNTLRPRQNGRHFPDDIFKCIFSNENVWISIKISLNFVPRGPINNIPALVQVMDWRRPGDKPLSEPMLASLLTHICVTRPQWVNWIGLN